MGCDLDTASNAIAATPRLHATVRRRVAIGLLALALVPLIAHSASAAPRAKLLGKKWIRARSPNFTLLSMLKEEDTTEILRELELFRQLVSRLSNARANTSPIPTRIFLLKRASDIEKMGVDEDDVLGLFLPGVRNNLILSAGASKYDQHVIQHEYAHFLADRWGGRTPPLWYSEGFAEFLASTVVEKDEVVFGDVPEIRRDDLEAGRWMPFEMLIDRAEVAELDSNQISMLYAQSWLLVHYLRLGRDDHDFAEELASYLRQLAYGVPDIVAFETSFDLEVASLHEVLFEYADEGRIKQYRIPIEHFDQEIAIQIEVPTKSEVAIAIAQAMMQLGATESAHSYVAYAIEHAPSSGTTWSTSAALLARTERFDEALPQIEKALKLAPDDPFVALDAADYWLRRASASDDTDPNRPKWLSLSRRAAIRASKIDDSIPEIYATYGFNVLEDGREPARAIEALDKAADLLPSNITIRLALMQANRRAGRGKTAIRLASSIVNSEHATAAAHQEALDSLREMLAVCTPRLAADLVEGIMSNVHWELYDDASTPVEGRASLSITLDESGDTQSVSLVEASSTEFGEAAVAAAHKASPFSSIRQKHRSCFSGEAVRIPVRFERRVSPCEESAEERTAYLYEINRAFSRALHDPIYSDPPGAGRIAALVRVDVDGRIDLLKYSRASTPEVRRKFEAVLDAYEPIGPRPGPAECWKAPSGLRPYVLGGDNEDF